MGNGEMERTETEKTILRKCLNALQEETGLLTQVVTRGETDLFQREWDGEIILITPDHNSEVDLVFELKKRVTRNNLGTIALQFNQLKKRAILLTRYVNPNLAVELKELGIQFLDACGNAYINTFPLYIYVTGNKPETIEKNRAVTTRAFRPAGLKVIYTLLCNPGLEREPFRLIATMAGVALGTVDAVFKNLKAIGYLIDKGAHGRVLVEKERLLEKWVTIYPDTLRPTLDIGRYTAKDKYWWKNAELPRFCFWGGEVAAAKTTKYLKPEIITIYTKVPPGKLLVENKLRKDIRGEIEILRTFWDKDEQEYNDKLVHPILVYADLIATIDARNHETAEMIYKNEIYRFIK